MSKIFQRIKKYYYEKGQKIKKRSKYVAIIFLGGFIYLLDSVEKVPYFERRRIMLLSEEDENKNFQKLNAKYKLLSNDSEEVVYLNKIAKKVLNSIGEEDEKKSWTFNVIESKTVSAHSELGRNIFFTTQILKDLDNEGDIAAVLAHECSHSLIRHQAERLSSQLVFIPVVNLVLLVFIGLDVAYISSKLFNYTYKLPKNRREEIEADTLGMFLMSRAGYHPQHMLTAFKKLEKHEKEKIGDVPEWSSTHPSWKKRKANINEKLPLALKLYRDGLKNKLSKPKTWYSDLPK